MTSHSSLDGNLFKEIICGGAASLKSHAAEVNNLNVFPVPDGDTGDNMAMTVMSGVASMKKTDSDSVGEVAAALSRGMLLGARGNSGVILSQFWSGVAKQLEGKDEVDATLLSEALSYGVKQAYRSVMSPTEGTILTVAREGVGNAIIRLDHEGTIYALLSNVKSEMFTSLSNTPNLLPVLKEAGVIDSGGAGLYYIFEGIVKTLSGEETSSDVLQQKEAPDTQSKTDVFSAFTEDSVMTYGYCTEFLLRLQSSKVDVASFDVSTITDYLTTIGNSIVSVKDGSVVKIHVHTLEPEKVLGFCRKYGEFLTMKIENMSVQHSEKLADGAYPSKETGKAVPVKEYGTVAVCSGTGIMKTFEELGADFVIDGGQTNNPSTEDFIKAFDSVSARHIFVFPNNTNIILAAKQAAELYKGAQIHVIESKDLGSGYVGLASFNTEVDSTDEMMSSIYESMQNVVTGCVTTAVRSTEIGGVRIENGDNICFVGKKMISSQKEKKEALHALVDYIFADGEKFMITAFCGKDTSAPDRDEFRAYMKKHHPDAELYLVDGGQDVYSYIVIAE